MNSGRIKNSRRLQRIVEIMQEADYPISSQEISLRAYPNALPDPVTGQKPVMLNVSTNIGEMRSAGNIRDGYYVSSSLKWIVCREGQSSGKHVNKDGSVTFFISTARLPFHDGRPRYCLESAPGWTPRWIITEHGDIRPFTGQRGDGRQVPTISVPDERESPWEELGNVSTSNRRDDREMRGRGEEADSETRRQSNDSVAREEAMDTEPDLPLLCMGCGEPLQPGQRYKGKLLHDEMCDELWHEKMFGVGSGSK